MGRGYTMKKLLILIILILSTSSFGATFSGSFQGGGKAKFKSGRSYPCHEIFLRLEETQEYFRLREGGYKCGGLLNAEFDPFRFMIQDGRLVHQGETFGTINNEELTYSVYDPADGSTYRLRLTFSGDELHYFEDWHDGHEIALTVEGVLKKIQ